MNLQAKSFECLFHYIYIQLDHFLTGAEFHTMFYQYLIQVCCLNNSLFLLKTSLISSVSVLVLEFKY